jgi:drug/metabolite transporter (DMT)-like permease
MNRSPTLARNGWVAFAGVMLALAAAFNFTWAMTAFIRDEYLIANLLFGDMTAWGVLYLIGAIVLGAISYLVFRRNPAAQRLGVALAAINVVGALLTIGAFPLWSVPIMVANALALYALTAHADGE